MICFVVVHEPLNVTKTFHYGGRFALPQCHITVTWVPGALKSLHHVVLLWFKALLPLHYIYTYVYVCVCERVREKIVWKVQSEWERERAHGPTISSFTASLNHTLPPLCTLQCYPLRRPHTAYSEQPNEYLIGCFQIINTCEDNCNQDIIYFKYLINYAILSSFI